MIKYLSKEGNFGMFSEVSGLTVSVKTLQAVSISAQL